MQRQMWKGSVCSKFFIIIIPVKTGNAPAKINWTNVLDIASLDEFSFYLCGNKAFTHLYLKFSYRSPCQWKIANKFHGMMGLMMMLLLGPFQSCMKRKILLEFRWVSAKHKWSFISAYCLNQNYPKLVLILKGPFK